MNEEFNDSSFLKYSRFLNEFLPATSICVDGLFALDDSLKAMDRRPTAPEKTEVRSQPTIEGFNLETIYW